MSSSRNCKFTFDVQFHLCNVLRFQCLFMCFENLSLRNAFRVPCRTLTVKLSSKPDVMR